MSMHAVALYITQYSFICAQKMRWTDGLGYKNWKQVVKVIWQKRPHRSRTWSVQWCLPGGANVHPCNTCFLGPTTTSPHTKWHLHQFSRFCTVHGTHSLYFTMGRPFFLPSNCPLCMGIWTHLITLPWTHQVHNPHGILMSSAVFAGLTTVIDWPRYSTCNNSPHQHS